MFSVVVPLYNKAIYIEKALLSILNQTYKEFEIIVIDDGSEDMQQEQPKQEKGTITHKYLQELVGDRGRIVIQKNSGVSTARNNGVKLAKYPYICFLDADDWWAPTFLEEMKGLIEEFPSAGIYSTSYYKVKNGKNIPARIGVEAGFERGVINYCKVYAKTIWMPLTSISVCVPKVVFDVEKGFKPNLKLGEDFDLWVRIAMKNKVVFLNKPLAYYNQDVEIESRAVGSRFYTPEEHMLFSNYGEWMNDADFRFLFERLALYGLLPYYLNDVNKQETEQILSKINWEKHEKKYIWFYKTLPKCAVRQWFRALEKVVRLKQKLKQ